jgi:hypothetical protein
MMVFEFNSEHDLKAKKEKEIFILKTAYLLF